MKYYPLFLDVTGRPCLVVGGGSVGTRKALSLLRSGARVRVVSPEFSQRLQDAAKGSKDLDLAPRRFCKEDLEGVTLVFAATNDARLNQEVRRAAAHAGVLCNVADGKDKGDFILPSVVERGDLVLAVSTCGASPALAKEIRIRLEQAFGPEYTGLTRLLAAVRHKLLAGGHDPEGHKTLFTELVQRDLAPLIAQKDHEKINQILHQVLGEGFSLDDLAAEES